jgi:hypothetical protein
MPMVTVHTVVLLDRDAQGVLQRTGEVHFESPEAACAAAQGVVPEHAGAIVLTLVSDPETGDVDDAKVHAVVGEWDMGALFRDP